MRTSFASTAKITSASDEQSLKQLGPMISTAAGTAIDRNRLQPPKPRQSMLVSRESAQNETF
jgi:hypothetical protein